MKTRILFLVIALAAAVAPAATSNPATKPSATSAAKRAPEDPLIGAAVAAVESNTLAAFVATVDKAASDALANAATADLSRVTQLATLREFGRWFSRVPQPSTEQKAALTWLIRQRKLAPTLMLSATSADPPDRVLNILVALRKDQHDRLERFADLAAAVCLVWDDPDRFGGEERPMDLPRVVRVFRDYLDNPSLTRDAAEHLPVDLLVFVVDNMLSESELDWARRQYPSVNVGTAFFDVGYGASRQLSREPPKADTDPASVYTIANVRKVGGSMADQTYYAAQLGKTFGVPTAACVGMEREGQESQSWVAYLVESSGGDARWDTTTGRHRAHALSPGTALDPQTMEPVPIGELTLTADVVKTPAAKRAAAAALCKLLDRVPPAQQLAALKRAVEASPSDRRVWRAVADWGRKHRPGSQEYLDVASLVTAQLMPRAEDVALDVRLRMIAKRTSEDRAAPLAEIRPAFAGHADLTATIQLARARALMEKKDGDGALRELGELLGKVDAIPAQAAIAMRIVDDLLRERSQLDRLAGVYDEVWSHMRAPAQSPVAHTTPYAAIGQEYAQLLEEMGRKQQLESVREKLGELWAEPVKR
jgi:hypothetical protein